MEPGSLFSVKEFAKFSRIPKDTLLYYDRIGLLSPEARGDNNYRYYSFRMLTHVNVIRTLQKLGMSLEEIKELKDHRTPELAERVLLGQIEKIDGKIEEWIRSRKLLMTYLNNIRDAANIDENALTIQFLPAEAIVLGGLCDYSRDRNAYDALLSFYQEIEKKYPEIDTNFPVWAIFTKDRVKQLDVSGPDRYYFCNPEGYDRRPAALYAIGYTRGDYGQNGGAYKRLLEYIDANGFEVCGNAYEEYPLNEVCITESGNYLIRVLIMVREKVTDAPAGSGGG